jgi:hypothetical protein
MAKPSKRGAVRHKSRGHKRQPTAASQLARSRALEALHLMRGKRRTMAQAAKEAGTTPRTVVRYAGSALSKTTGRRYRAKPADRLLRSLRFLAPDGLITVEVRGSRKASTIAGYWAAADRYLKTGETSGLMPFRGKSIAISKTRYPFITDPRTLDSLGNAGEVQFEDLYAAAT